MPGGRRPGGNPHGGCPWKPSGGMPALIGGSTGYGGGLGTCPLTFTSQLGSYVQVIEMQRGTEIRRERRTALHHVRPLAVGRL